VLSSYALDGTPAADARRPGASVAALASPLFPRASAGRLLPEGRRVTLTRLAANLAFGCRPAQAKAALGRSEHGSVFSVTFPSICTRVPQFFFFVGVLLLIVLFEPLYVCAWYARGFFLFFLLH
jgi:hypothetical protein